MKDPIMGQTVDYSRTSSFSGESSTVFNNFGTTAPFPTPQEGTLVIGWADTLFTLSKIDSVISAKLRVRNNSSNVRFVQVSLALVNNRGLWLWYFPSDTLYPADSTYKMRFNVGDASKFGINLDSVYILAIGFQVRTIQPNTYAWVEIEMKNFDAGIVTGVSGVRDLSSSSSFQLDQNYPNPFNPTTTINFSVSTTEKVVLKVYDVLGREISTLVNKEMSAGNHRILFDGSKLSSGMYVYRLEAGKYIETKKMLLVK